MGSLVVRCFCQKYDQDIDGLIVCGSPSDNPLAPIGTKIARIYSKVKDDHYRPQLIQNLSFQAFNKRFHTDIPNSWICSDENIVDSYNKNPLCYFTFTANGFESLFNLVINTYHNEKWTMSNPSLPILFIAGKDDPCITNEVKFNKAVSNIKSKGYMCVDSYLFENMRHEILNEKQNQLVYQYILDNLNAWQTNI